MFLSEVSVVLLRSLFSLSEVCIALLRSLSSLPEVSIVDLFEMSVLFESRATGWQRLIGFPKLQIILHKRATKYRALLRKMTHKVKGSYESSPPCTRWRRLVGCLELHIMFCKRATGYRALLRKTTMMHPICLRHPVHAFQVCIVLIRSLLSLSEISIALLRSLLSL